MKYLLAAGTVVFSVAAAAAPALAATWPAPPATQAQDARFAPFVGAWQRRDAYLAVFEDGSAVARWRVGLCDMRPPPCDSIEGGVLRYGGRAEIRLTGGSAGEPPAARGEVLSTADGVFELGPVWLLRAAPDLVAIIQPTATVWVCREPRNLNHCD